MMSFRDYTDMVCVKGRDIFYLYVFLFINDFLFICVCALFYLFILGYSLN